MNKGTIQTYIISPEEEIYSGQSEMVVVPGEEGDFGAMYEHAPLITYLRPGKIEVYKSDNKESIIYFVTGGFVRVEGNKCQIMVDYIKKIKDIDVKANEEKINFLLEKVEKVNDNLLKSDLLYEINLLKSENSSAVES